MGGRTDGPAIMADTAARVRATIKSVEPKDEIANVVQCALERDTGMLQEAIARKRDLLDAATRMAADVREIEARVAQYRNFLNPREL